MPRPKFVEVEEVENRKSISAFIVGCGGFTEAIYLQNMVGDCAEVRIELLPPDKTTNLSSPLQTVERVNAFWDRFDPEPEDQVWLVLDVDHFFDTNHIERTDQALGQAWRRNYQVAVSNPCFELWMLLHTEEVLASWPDCASLEAHLRRKWGSYGKKKFDVETLRPLVSDAIARAHRLDSTPQVNPPRNPGTRMHLLMEALNAACSKDKIF